MKHPRTAGDLMTRNVVVLHPEDDLTGIAEGMALFELRQIPVVDDGVLIGVVDERTVVGTMPPRRDTPFSKQLRRLQAERSFVAGVMEAPAKSVTVSATLKEVVESFERLAGDSLPVVDDTGRLVGLILPEQVARLAATLLGDAPPSRNSPTQSLRAA